MSNFNTDILFIHIPKNAGTALKSILLQYNFILTGHNIDFDWVQKNQFKTLIVVRDPVSRFISSVNYSINNAANEQLSNNILEHIKSPNDWANSMFDSKHHLHGEIWNCMYNNKKSRIHQLNNRALRYRWHWSEQYLWINNPTYVLLYDNLYEEFNIFLKNIFHINTKITLPHINVSNGQSDISDNNKQKIYRFYQQDLNIYEQYKKMHPNTRLDNNIFANIFDTHTL